MNTQFPKKIADNVNMYSGDPILYVVNDFVSESECAEFIAASNEALQGSAEVSRDQQITLEGRTSKNYWIQHDANEVIHEVSKRLSILTQIPIRNAEQFELVLYKQGTQYRPRFDSFDYETEDGKKKWEPGGQRMITVMVFLNDVQAGGETHFPELGVTITPKKGDVVIFHNTLTEVPPPSHPRTHPKSIHAGMPVIKGEKWMVNLRFRENLRY